MKLLFDILPELHTELGSAGNEELHHLGSRPHNDTKFEEYIYLCYIVFSRLGSVEYLVRGAKRARGWLATTSSTNPDRERREKISNAIHLLLGQNHKGGEPSRRTVDEAKDPVITKTRELHDQFLKTDNYCYLNRAIQFTCSSLEKLPLDSPHYARYSDHLGRQYFKRYETNDCIEDLDRAIVASAEGVAETALGDPNKGPYSWFLGKLLCARYSIHSLNGQNKSKDDLERAKELVAEAGSSEVVTYSGDYTELVSKLQLAERSSVVEKADNHDAKSPSEIQFTSIPNNQKEKAIYFYQIGAQDQRKYDQYHHPQELDNAIFNFSASLAFATFDDIKGNVLYGLGTSMANRWELFGEQADLDLAITHLEMAVEGEKSIDVKIKSLTSLGHQLTRRFALDNNRPDIDRAIESNFRALQVMGFKQGSRANAQESFAAALHARFDAYHELADIERAIMSQEEAIYKNPASSARAINYNNLSRMYRSKYLYDNQNGKGDPKTLEDAIEACQNGLEELPLDQPDRGIRLEDLRTLVDTKNELDVGKDL